MATKISGTTAELIGIGVASVLIIVVTAILYSLSSNIKTTAVSETKVERVPPLPSGFTPYVTPINCLPSGTSNSELVPCDTQNTCYACTETPGNQMMNCSVVSDSSGELNPDGTFVEPFSVSAIIDSEEECSGHGILEYDQCVCDGSLEAGDTVIYSGDKCEVQTTYIDKPGNYCLPAYTNVCDSATSDVILGGF